MIFEVTRAPEFTGISHWFNTKPTTLRELLENNQAVLIDFWTYSCINCVRTLPHIKKWWKDYQDKGFVLIGVHTPEFEFEKDIKNIEAAIRKYQISYPVAVDNDYATWNAYSNHYWPAHYLVNKEGKIIYHHFGEGEYNKTENAIRELLGLGEIGGSGEAGISRDVRTPEIYLGQARSQPGYFTLEGKWAIADEHVELVEAPGKIKLNYWAAKVHIVASSDNPVKVIIKVDGKKINEVEIKNSDLYTLVDGKPGRHSLELEINDPGFRAFAFTFG